jgi:hypothetical protein
MKKLCVLLLVTISLIFAGCSTMGAIGRLRNQTKLSDEVDFTGKRLLVISPLSESNQERNAKYLAEKIAEATSIDVISYEEIKRNIDGYPIHITEDMPDVENSYQLTEEELAVVLDLGTMLSADYVILCEVYIQEYWEQNKIGNKTPESMFGKSRGNIVDIHSKQSVGSLYETYTVQLKYPFWNLGKEASEREQVLTDEYRQEAIYGVLDMTAKEVSDHSETPISL